MRGKTGGSLVERRKFVRLDAPIEVDYAMIGGNRIHAVISKDISAEGMRFEARDKDLAEAKVVELKLNVPGPNPIHAKGRVVWKRKLSLADSAPFDVGIEFEEIEEDNKNTFLKYLCDLMYRLSKGD
jgi:c-di-GMP-binding flagellar brake protein YcgR